MKQKVKSLLLQRMHAREEIVSRIATRVLRVGVVRRLNWSFDEHADNTMRYLSACARGGSGYSFSSSHKTPVLYASLYAFMLHSLLDRFSNQKQIDSWIDYFDEYQTDNGLFRDPVLACSAFEHIGEWGEGWGTHHLTAHMVIPYMRAGRCPPHPFRFLEKFYDSGYIELWLERFQFRNQLWSQSNYIMNLYSVLQFARDSFNEPRASKAVEHITCWLRNKQNPLTGLWHDQPLTNRAQVNDAVRAAYHYYPLFEYDRIPLPYQEQTIAVILSSQNAWGAFDREDLPAGACEDIDALDPLLRFAYRLNHRDRDVDIAAERALIWVLSCRNDDGGSCSMPEHGFHYGGHPLTTSSPGESNLFATWFRTLTVAYISQYLELSQNFKIGHYPGYEILHTKCDSSTALD